MQYSVFSNLNADLSGVAYKEHQRKKKLITHLSNKGELAIPELAEMLTISIPKTTELINGLLEEGLVVESGRKTDGVGRKAAVYSLNKESCYFLGVEIKKYKVNLALMGFDKTVIASSVNIPFPFSGTSESVNAIIKDIHEFLNSSRISKDKILGVGLSIAGRINVKTGQILTIYHFADVPINIKTILEEALDLPVYIDNDSRTLAYGEYFFSEESLPKTTLILNIDYGLALGIFIDGKPVYGASGYAGELGHIPIFNNEKICFCGKKGCMETEASGYVLIDYITAKMKEGVSSRLQKTLSKKGYLELEDIVEAVHLGDNLAIEAVSAIAYNLGKGLSVAINLFNPELIVLGGILAGAGTPLLLPVQSSIYQFSLGLVSNDTRVVLSAINEKAGLLGSCLLVRDKVLGLV
ncbi:ROK family transcriptional regulator [Foetidibacter luteolus]|uniref:ROK family transcriptional regulator n=1 Tax=Foetidibacter luteolus TaxID=2608880 RepID=UPI00129A1A17|nr:ROK family protein [Foetidibacter luteolus]